jgi:hypothetical protein
MINDKSTAHLGAVEADHTHPDDDGGRVRIWSAPVVLDPTCADDYRFLSHVDPGDEDGEMFPTGWREAERS